jgi:hypothetical protein
MHRQSRDGLITEDVVQGAVAQRLILVVGIDTILIVGQRSGELHRALLVPISKTWVPMRESEEPV